MLLILNIVLVTGMIFLGFVILMLQKRISELGRQSVREKLDALPVPTQPDEPSVTPVDEVKTEPESEPIPQKKRKTEFLKPEIPNDARIEQITALYSDMPGILGAIFADRFGQTIAADTNLVLDRVAIPAYFIEILSLARNERLPIGKPNTMFINGEGSYWIFGEVAGMPWGLWLEHEIDIKTGAALAEDFRQNIIVALKSNYTRIW